MARKLSSNADGYIKPDDDLDMSVLGLIDHGQRQQATARLSKPARAKKAKRDAKYQDKQKAQQTLIYLSEGSKGWIDQTAKQLGCTASQVTEFAIRYLQSGSGAGVVDLVDYLTPIENPRYSNRLEYPQFSTNP